MRGRLVIRCLPRAFVFTTVLLLSSTAGSLAESSAGGPYVGVWTSGPSGQEAAALDDLGVGWARVFVVWSSVEPSDGVLAWSELDSTMALASGNGRRTVLAQVRDNPAWAASNRCLVNTDLERRRLARFVGDLAARYPGVVWQLYNEMDNTSIVFDTQNGLGGCFGTLGADGRPSAEGRVQYALAVEAAGAAVHAADPHAQLAAGGVASGNFTETNGIFDRAFLPGVLAQLKRDSSLDSLDYVTVHYYSSQAGGYAGTGRDLLGRLNQLRLDVLAAGLSQDELKPVLSDELSYTSGATGTSNADPTDIFNRGQAAYVPKVLSRAVAANVRAVLWFWLRDAPSGLGADNAYGLLDRTGAPKPSYVVLRYFVGVVSRADQFLSTLDLSDQSSTLEGYRFATADGGSVQIVWNETDPATAPITYSPSCTVVFVTDAAGTPTPFDSTANALMLNSAPSYIFCAAAG